MSATDGNYASSHASSKADSHGHDDDHGPPPPPEPHTPMWLPAVGALLFLSVGLIWALSTPSQPAPEGSAAPRNPAANVAPDAGAAPARAAPAH